MSNFIKDYHEQIQDGRIIAGKWIKLIYDYIVRGLEEGLFYFNEEKADAVIEFIETKCYHTEGHLAPGPLKLELWQKAMLSCIFGIVDEEGFRVFRECCLIIGRKNGKSKIASSIAKFLLVNGGYGTRIFTIAPKLDQADIIYNDVWQMITLDPEWKKLPERSPDKARSRKSDLCIEATNSTVKKIAFSAKKSDGFNPSLAITDEISSWEGD